MYRMGRSVIDLAKLLRTYVKQCSMFIENSTMLLVTYTRRLNCPQRQLYIQYYCPEERSLVMIVTCYTVRNRQVCMCEVEGTIKA